MTIRLSSFALAVVCFAAVSLLGTSPASAQYYNPGYNYQTGSSIVLDNTIRRPTVSPYLNLLLPGGQLGTNYQTLVRPQLDQERANREAASRINQLQQQFNQAVVNSGAPRSRQDGGIRPTGHQSAYLNYSHYYRMPAPPR